MLVFIYTVLESIYFRSGDQSIKLRVAYGPVSTGGGRRPFAAGGVGRSLVFIYM